MHKSAGILLIIAFILDLIAGMAYVAAGALGGGFLALMGTMGDAILSMGGESAESLPFMQLAAQVGGGLAAAGVLVIVAGVLAVLAAARLVDGRSGTIVYVGATAAIVADAVPLGIIGFNPFQIPGLLGGVLGLVAGYQLSAADPSAPATDRQPTTRARTLFWVGAAVVVLAMYWYSVRPTDRPSHAAVPAQNRGVIASQPETPGIKGAVKGQLAGFPFEPHRIFFEGWVFTFHQREDFEFTVHLNLDKDALPEQLELVVDENSTAFDSPTIFIDYPEGDSEFGKTNIVQDGYRMRLVTGKLTGNRIPGSIELDLHPSQRTHVAGNFESFVEGRVDVEPDLTRAGLSSFRYLGFQYLEQIHLGAALEIDDNVASYQTGDASKDTQYGHSVLAYRIGEQEHVVTVQLKTRDGRWEIVGALEPGQLAAAHPLIEPEPGSIGVVTLAAARHVEIWLNENHPDRVAWTVSVFGPRNMQLGRAGLNAHIHLRGDDAPIKRRLYLERAEADWRYVRDLADDERFKRKTGEIVPK